MTDWKLSGFHKKGYGRDGKVPPDAGKCAAEIRTSVGLMISKYYQCSRKRGHGPEQAYCKTHDPAAVAARQKKSLNQYKEQSRRRSIEFAGHRFLKVLREIAAGHNDPRALARDAIKEFEP
jgi:hypothetical protein